jgi:hypothetical protein
VNVGSVTIWSSPVMLMIAAMERTADRAMERGARDAQDHLPAVGILGKPAAMEPRPVALLHPRTGRPIKGAKSLKN